MVGEHQEGIRPVGCAKDNLGSLAPQLYRGELVVTVDNNTDKNPKGLLVTKASPSSADDFLKTSITPDQVVQVFELSDFPDPVAGVITLATGTRYIICADINFGTNQMSFGTDGEISIVGANPFTYQIISEIPAATPFIIGSVGRVDISDVDITTVTTGQGVLFDLTASGASIPSFTMRRIRYIGFESLGTIRGTRGALDRMSFVSNSDGITFEDSGAFPAAWTFEEVGFTSQGGDHVTFTGTNSLIGIETISGAPTTGNALLNFDSAGTYDSVVVDTCVFTNALGGTFLASGSKDQTDPEFRFVNNLGVRDSTVKGSAYFVGNSTETTISAANTPVAVAGTTIAGELERFTHNSSGILTYIGKEPITARVEGRLQLEVNANLEEVTIATYIYKNGVQQASTVAQVTIASVFQTPTSPEFVSVDNLQLDTNDTLQVYIENQTDTTNITVTELKLII